MDSPTFNLPVYDSDPNKYTTEAALEARVNTALDSVQSNSETYGRYGWIEDIYEVTGVNTWVAQRRSVFEDLPVYETGKKYLFKAPAANTGSVTIAIADELARPLLDTNGAELQGGEIVAGRYYMVRCGANSTGSGSPRVYLMVSGGVPEKERLATVTRTGLIQLTNVVGGNAISAETFAEATAPGVNTGTLYVLTAEWTNNIRDVTLAINGASALPLRTADGASQLQIGDLKAQRTYILRRSGSAADRHFRVVLGIDGAAGGAASVDFLAGGSAGQVPRKVTGADFDIEWADPTGGATGVPTSREVTGVGDIAGGGDLSADRALDLTAAAKAKLALANSAVQPPALAAVASDVAGKEPRHELVEWSGATRSLLDSDDRKILRATNAAPQLTILTQTGGGYPDGMFVSGTASNGLTIVGAAGVTINGVLAGSIVVGEEANGAGFTLYRAAANAWVVTIGGAAVGGGGGGDVASVNGRTGAVVLDAQDVGALRAIYVVAEDYTGTPEVRLNSAIAAAIATGKPVWIGGDYSITAALAQVNVGPGERLDVRGPGRITIAGDIARPIVVASVWPAPVGATSLTLGIHTFPGGVAATECTIVAAPGHGLAAGAIVKLIANDPIPGEINTDRRVGEWFHVGAVVGDNLYLTGRPIDTFSAGIRVQEVPTDTNFSWSGPTIDHTPDQEWQVHALTVRGFVGADIDIVVEHGYDCGVQLQSCMQTRIVADCRDMLNKISSEGISGYGVQDCGGALTQAELRGYNARHFYTTGTLTSPAGGDAYLFGRTYGFDVTGQVASSTGAAGDVHSSGFGGTLRNFTVLGGELGEDSAGAAYQLRGRDVSITDGVAIGAQHGIQFWGQVDGDGQEMTATGFRYHGAGDAIRFGAEPGVVLRAPRVIGGRYSVTENLRTFFVKQASRVTFTGPVVTPKGSGSGSRVMTIGADVDEVWISDLELDLTDFGGTSYDFLGVDSGVTCRVVIDRPRIIDPNGVFRSWVNGTGAAELTVELRGGQDTPEPNVGDVINDPGGAVAFTRTGGGGLSGSIASIITEAAADPETGPGLAAAIEDAVAAGDSHLLTPDTLADVAEQAALDDVGAAAPARKFGAAVSDAMLTLEGASIQSWLSAFYYRMGLFAAAFDDPPDPGSLVLVGDTAGNRTELVTAPISDVTQTPDTWPHANDVDGKIEYLTDAEAILRLERGASAPIAVAPSSGVLSYDPRQHRRAYLLLNGNLTLNPSIWNSTAVPMIMDPELDIIVDGTPRTLNVGPGLPGDGLIVQAGGVDVTLPLTLAANGRYSLLIGRRFGGIPLLRVVGEGYSVEAPTAFYVGTVAPDIGSPGTRTLTVPCQVGDLVMAMAVNTSGTGAPGISGFTTVPGIGADGLAGVTTVGKKVATSTSETITTTTAPATQLHAAVFRKSSGSPQVQSAVQYNRASAASSPTSTWDAFSIANRGLVLGFHGWVSSDSSGGGAPLRPEFGSATYDGTAAGSNNRFAWGVTDTLPGGTNWSSTTTTKSGTVGRDVTASIAIY